MRLRKYQAGGIVYKAFIPPATQTTSEVQASSNMNTASSPKTSKVDEALIKMIQTEGIQSDVDVLLNQYKSYVNRTDILGNKVDYTMSDIVNMQSSAVKVQRNKAIFDQAKDNLTTENAWNEVATNANGSIYAWDKNGDIKLLNVNDYVKNKDKYQALTNSQLANARETNPKLAFNTTIPYDLNNAVGTHSINTYTADIMKQFQSEKVEGYAQKNKGLISKGFEAMLNDGYDGVYKYSTENNIDKTQEGVNAAVDYVWSRMPQSMKNVLYANAAVNGENPGKDVSQFIHNTIIQGIKSSVTLDREKPDDTGGSSGGKSGSGGSNSSVASSLRADLANGNLGEIKDKKISVGDGSFMTVKTQDTGQLIDADKKPLDKMNMADVFLQSAQFQVTNQGYVTFGNQLINADELNKIIPTTGAEVYRVMMPYTKTSEGRITPDFTLFKKYNDFKDHLESAGQVITTPMIENALKLYFPQGGVTYNKETEDLSITNQMPFMVMSAYTNSDVLESLNTDSKFVSKITDDRKSLIGKTYDDLISFSKTNPGKSDKPAYPDQETANWWGDYYEANLYAPITNGSTNAIYEGSYIPKDWLTLNVSKIGKGDNNQTTSLKTRFDDK